jgi:hypothetical protein
MPGCFCKKLPTRRCTGRVTRLATFSSIGQFFTFGSYFEIFTKPPNAGLLFSHGKSYALILTKMDWAISWAIFSQTHLVTLLTCIDLAEVMKI